MVPFGTTGENREKAQKNRNFLRKKVSGKMTNEFQHFFSLYQKKCENLTGSASFFIILAEQKARSPHREAGRKEENNGKISCPGDLCRVCHRAAVRVLYG